MSTLVSCDAHAGVLRRYECGGEVARPTHEARWPVPEGRAIAFTPALVEEFRLNPPDACALTPGPTPTPPNAGAGTSGGPANDETEEVRAVAA